MRDQVRLLTDERDNYREACNDLRAQMVNGNSRAAWAQEQLRILADMLDDRAMDWAANEARRIADGLNHTRKQT